MLGLARTTASPPSFILMGADTSPHIGVLRPSDLLPLPQKATKPGQITSSTLHTSLCLGEMLLSSHPDRSSTQPLYTIKQDDNGKSLVYTDVGAGQETIRKVQQLDVQDNILVILAHDASIKHVLKYWPESANGWMNEGWKSECTWSFLKDYVGEDEQGQDSRL